MKYITTKNLYKWSIASLAIISIVLIILDFAAVIDINGHNSKWFWLNNIILIILAVNYFSRLYLANDRKKFIQSHIFDLLAIIPVGLAFNWMQLANLGDVGLYFRLLRLIRLAGLIGMLREIWHTNGILYVLYFSIAFLMLGSVAISITEHVSLDRAFWWAITTASTVGYGDIAKDTITPDSLIGKLVILIMILVGVGIMGVVTSSLTAYLMRRNAGKGTMDDAANLQIIMAKLDDVEKQNQLLLQQNKEMHQELAELKAQTNKHEWSKFKNWLKERENKSN